MENPRQIVCPHCQTVIRVPVTRLADDPKCARCHRALFTAQSVELSAATFDQHRTRDQIPVVVDFWAPWCGPCRMMAPAYEQAARQLEPQARLARVNTENEPGLAARYGIRSIPTLVLFAQGREIARQSGALAAEQIVSWVRTHARADTVHAAQA